MNSRGECYRRHPRLARRLGSATVAGADEQTVDAIAREVSELRDRIDRVVAHDPADVELALRIITWTHPDLVTEALDEAGAPS